MFPSTIDPSMGTELMESSEQRSRRLAAHGILTNFACAAATAYDNGFTLYHEVGPSVKAIC